MNNNLANCVQCGKLFRRIDGSICSDCARENDTKLQIVKDFLRKNRKSSIEDTVLATGVTLNEIIFWLQTGHLILYPDSNITYPCEKCGRSIRKGRFCAECANELKLAFGGAVSKTNDTDELHGRFLSRRSDEE